MNTRPLVAGLVLLMVAEPLDAQVSNADVDGTIRRGVANLWSRQQERLQS